MDLITICPFALMTGHACPLCGATRAVVAMVRMDVLTAWQMHPLIVLATPLAIWALIAWTVGLTNPATWIATRRGVVLALMLVVGTWLVRATTGSLPPV